VRLLLCALGPGAFPTRQLPDDVAAGVSRKQRLGRVACVRALRSLPGLPGYLHAWRFASRTARTWARAREGRRMHAETTPTGWWALTVNLTLHRRWAPPRHTRAAGRPQLGPEPPRPTRWRQVPGRRAGRRRAADRGPQQRRARMRGRRGTHGRRALAVHLHAARGRLLPPDARAARRAGRRQPLLRAGGRPHNALRKLICRTGDQAGGRWPVHTYTARLMHRSARARTHDGVSPVTTGRLPAGQTCARRLLQLAPQEATQSLLALLKQ